MSKFYKVEDYGIISIPDDVEIDLSSNGNELVELVANSTDAAGEKHVPKVTVDGNKVIVEVGEVHHPMLDEHWINDIVLDTNKGTYTKKLVPGTDPVATFILEDEETPITVYEFCNLHGLWKKDL